MSRLNISKAHFTYKTGCCRIFTGTNHAFWNCASIESVLFHTSRYVAYNVDSVISISKDSVIKPLFCAVDNRRQPAFYTWTHPFLFSSMTLGHNPTFSSKQVIWGMSVLHDVLLLSICIVIFLGNLTYLAIWVRYLFPNASWKLTLMSFYGNMLGKNKCHRYFCKFYIINILAALSKVSSA